MYSPSSQGHTSLVPSRKKSEEKKESTSRPERVIGSLLASPSRRCLETTRDSDPQLALIASRKWLQLHYIAWNNFPYQECNSVALVLFYCT